MASTDEVERIRKRVEKARPGEWVGFASDAKTLLVRIDELEAQELYLEVRKVAAKIARDQIEAAKNLLAVMHRDGGHHTEQVGFIQSCKDAENVRHNLVRENDELLWTLYPDRMGQ